MPTLLSIQSGNFTNSATWETVNAASLLTTQTTAQNVTTTLVASSNFVPGAVTVLGIALQMSQRLGTTGTFTMNFFNSSTATSLKTVIINCSDFPNASSTGGGWLYFPFDSAVTTTAGQNYQVRLSSSTTNQVSFWRDGTLNNWNRALVTDTNATPADTDTLIICGSYSAAGINNTVTVTMNSTATTVFFNTIYVDCKGELKFETSASTNYRLNLRASPLFIRGGGTGLLEIGNSANPIPATSTAILYVTGTTSQIRVTDGIFRTFGTLPTVTKAKLSADVAAGATSASTDVSTGWLSGQNIIIPSTTRTSTQHEFRTLTANSVSNRIFFPALTNAHGGNSSTFVQADVVLLDRNVKVIVSGTTTSDVTNIVLDYRGTIDLNNTELINLANTSTQTAGIFCTNTTSNASLSLNGCSMWLRVLSSQSNGITPFEQVTTSINNSIFYRYQNNYNGAFANNAERLTDSFFIGANLNGVNLTEYKGIITGNTITSNGAIGLSVNGTTLTAGVPAISIENNNIYSNATQGVGIGITIVGTNSNFININRNYVWRNGTQGGIQYNGINSYGGVNIFDNIIFGNDAAGFTYNANGIRSSFILMTGNTIYGGTTLVQPVGLTLPLFVENFYGINNNFGFLIDGTTPSNHTTSNIANGYGFLIFFNTKFSGTIFSRAISQPNFYFNGGFTSINHNQVTGSHFVYNNEGQLNTDTTIFSGVSPSLRLTPNGNNSATTKRLKSNFVKVAVNSGSTVYTQVRIRRSTAGDGGLYNGTAPSLMVKANPLAGPAFYRDIEIGAFSGTAGVWGILSGTTSAVQNDCVLDFFVACDGTTGWINIDDWSTTTSNDTRGFRYYSFGYPYVEADYSTGSVTSGGGSWTFVG